MIHVEPIHATYWRQRVKFILIVFMAGSGATGGTMPIALTATFDDKAACEAGAAVVDKLSRTHRIFGSRINYECVPSASENK